MVKLIILLALFGRQLVSIDQALALKARPKCVEKTRKLLVSPQKAKSDNHYTLKLAQFKDKSVGTQINYGIPSVIYRRAKFRKKLNSPELSKNETTKWFNDYFEKRPIWAYIGPDGRLWIIDRHHMGLTVEQLLDGDELSCAKRLNLDEIDIHFEIEQDCGDMQMDEFFSLLTSRGHFHLFDQGEQVSTTRLQPKLTSMQEDFHRGLAWILREAYVFEKVEHKAYFEFEWADQLRQVLPDKNFYDVDTIIQAIDLIRSSDSFKHLKGYKEKPVKLETIYRRLYKLMSILHMEDPDHFGPPGQLVDLVH